MIVVTLATAGFHEKGLVHKAQIRFCFKKPANMQTIAIHYVKFKVWVFPESEQGDSLRGV